MSDNGYHCKGCVCTGTGISREYLGRCRNKQCLRCTDKCVCAYAWGIVENVIEQAQCTILKK